MNADIEFGAAQSGDEPEGSIGETVVGPVDGHLVTILWGSLRFH